MKPAMNRLLLGTAVLVFAALGTLAFLERSSDETAAIHLDTTPLNLQWRVGVAQSYDVLIDSYFRMTTPGVGSAGSAQTMTVRMGGVLEFQTLKVGPAETLVGMRFSSLEMLVSGVSDPETNRVLTLPFRVRFASSGLPMAFEFPGALTADLRGVIENLVRIFQVAMQDGETWVAQESNASGVYEAVYRRTTPSHLEKTKQRYVGSTTATADAVPDIASNESVRIDAKRDWIAAMTVDETIRTRDPYGPSVEVTNHATLELLPMSLAYSVDAPDAWNFVATAAPDRANQAKVTGPALSREEAEKQLRTGVAALDVALERRSIWIHRLRDLILVDAELPFMLLETMREQELTDDTRADLYLVFELAGSPEAQSALVSVLTDTTWSPEDALRAIVALGGVANPTGDTLEALQNTALSGQSDGDRRHLAGTATLALGSLGRGLNAAEDANYYSLRTDLVNGAFSWPDPHQRVVFVHALGNTADPSLRSDIVPLLSDPAPVIRSAAAETLGRLGTNEVADELMRRFEQEESSAVRGAIAEALVSWEHPTLSATESIRAAIRQEPDEEARYNMARFLAQNLAMFPENRIVLQDLLRFEQSKRIRQQVTEMLAAANLM